MGCLFYQKCCPDNFESLLTSVQQRYTSKKPKPRNKATMKGVMISRLILSGQWRNASLLFIYLYPDFKPLLGVQKTDYTIIQRLLVCNYGVHLMLKGSKCLSKQPSLSFTLYMIFFRSKTRKKFFVLRKTRSVWVQNMTRLLILLWTIKIFFFSGKWKPISFVSAVSNKPTTHKDLVVLFAKKMICSLSSWLMPVIAIISSYFWSSWFVIKKRGFKWPFGIGIYLVPLAML